MHPQSVLSKNQKKSHIFSYENYHFYSREILQYIARTCLRNVYSVYLQGVRNIAAISLNIGYPTACSAPHSIINGFKRLLAVAVETDIDFEEANQVSRN